MSFQVEYYSDTDVGLKRKNNQDSLFINKEHQVFFLADGLGGHACGEVASSMTIECANRYFNENIEGFKKQSNPNPQDFLEKSVNYANSEVFKQSQNHLPLKGMGTTLVVLWIYDKKMYIAHIGDSRAYLIQNQKIWQLTEDHILCKNEIKKGFKIQEKILNSHFTNALTKSIGLYPKIQPDLLTRNIQPNDTYLICSDGLHGLVPAPQILEIFNSEDLKNAPSKCKIKALSAGGLDNIAVIVLKVTSS